jgi:DNA repair exonuclease SbcCD ATPase subunit/DNA repair exonuclease SbcCD nuclease subunit
MEWSIELPMSHEKMIKICHLSDIHWRGLQRHDEYVDAFNDFFQKMRKLQPDLIVVAGDIVHSKTQGITPELVDKLRWWFMELSKWKTVVILGNHDGLIHNRSRLDAISPIIAAINNENLVLLKDSGNYELESLGINFANFSCFDEENWDKCKPVDGKINIALYHGAVGGSLLDTGMPIEGEVTVDMFRKYDFTMLGDIHRHQFLDDDKRIAYPGSTIQQNYGEDVDKGFLFWRIKGRNEFRNDFVKLKNPCPFYTIDWQGDVTSTMKVCESLPISSRVRVATSENVTISESRQLTGELRKKVSASEVVWKFVGEQSPAEMKAGETILSRENLRDPATIKGLFKRYSENKGMSQSFTTSLESTIAKLIDELPNDEMLGNTRWSIKKLRWDNTYAYGKENEIDFEGLYGITGIFGKNAQGKSSIPGTIMYSLFNTTDRGPIKNLHIINTRKDYCKASVDFQAGSVNYTAERQSVKHQTKAGHFHAITHLNLFKLDGDGNPIEDISGEQRKDSDKVLRSLIGTSDDFLLTSFAAQGEMNTFLKERATARKNILSKFLNLQVFDSLNSLAKEHSSSIRTELKRLPAVDIKSLISSKIDEEQSLQDQVQRLESEKSSLESHVKKLNAILERESPGSSHTLDDIYRIENEIEATVSKIDKNKNDLKKAIEERDDLRLKIDKVESAISEIDIEQLRFDIDRLEKISKKITEIDDKAKRELDAINSLEKSVKKLQDVPCGDSFPTCKYIKDSHKDRELLPGKKKAFDEIVSGLDELKLSFDAGMLADHKTRLDKAISLQSKLPAVKTSHEAHKSRVETLESLKSNLENDLDRKQKNLQELRAVISASDLESVKKMQEELQEEETKIKSINRSILQATQKIGAIYSEIERLKSDVSRIEKMQADWKVYEMIIAATGKDGIPLQIIASQLPRINNEIAKILNGVVNFNVELLANENDGDLEIFIDYGDSKRPIELSSGMEKMISSLAIRTALIEVSAIPKPDLFIIDEGFGALDDTNLEACVRLLTSLKRNFKNMLIISHVDSIKDIVDNVIEISHDGIDARVRY